MITLLCVFIILHIYIEELGLNQASKPVVPIKPQTKEYSGSDSIYENVTHSRDSTENYSAQNPDEYENNEILIFNRWGNIVYSASPYNNDWNGVSQSGKPLPEGTYYYVLRLNLNTGEIYKGDITILR